MVNIIPLKQNPLNRSLFHKEPWHKGRRFLVRNTVTWYDDENKNDYDALGTIQVRPMKNILIIVILLSVLFTSCTGKDREAENMTGNDLNNNTVGTGGISDTSGVPVTPALQAGDDTPKEGDNSKAENPQEGQSGDNQGANGNQGSQNQQPKQNNVDTPDVAGVSAQMQNAAFWIDRYAAANEIILKGNAISEYNSGNFQQLPFLNEPVAQSETLSGDKIQQWINNLSTPSSSVRYDEKGKQYQNSDYDRLKENLNLQHIPNSVTVRFGVTVKRVLMRTWPSARSSFSTATNQRFDYFAETAVYPAEPVAIYHTSADGQWLFAEIYHYRAWIPAEAVAICTSEELTELHAAPNKLIITGAKIITPDAADRRISGLQLDMGVALPLVDKNEKEYIVRYPVRDQSGKLEYAELRLPRSAELSEGYLDYTTEKVLTQAFKFLGEPYGWGGMNDARDCTAFLVDIYRSFGIRLPRNSDQQEQIPGAISLEGKSRSERIQILESLRPGSTLYMPGHAMMYLGEYEGRHYIIHDVTSVYEKGQESNLKQIPLNQAVVTPLEVFNSKGTEYIMYLTNVVEID